MLSLTVEQRDNKAPLKSLRTSGKMPAVIYGPKVPATSVSIPLAAFKKVFREAGESSIITLSGVGEEHDTLIYDVDLDPVTGEPRHADFYAIEKGKKVQVDVPLHFEGVSPAVKNLGGILVKVVHELEIEAAPKDLPHSIIVDISSLAELNSQILAKDIVLPAGVELLAEPGEVVALIAEAKEEVVEAPVATDLSAIEVEKKGKKEEDGEGEAAAEAPAKEE